MANIWLTSDQHFQHANILKFRKSYPDGEFVRPGFKDVDHMNEHMIEAWNSVVKHGEDHVYCLGDIALGNKSSWFKIFNRLQGKKRLILGNHDSSDMSRYQPWFEKIMSWRHFGDAGVPMIATHFPIHPNQFHSRKAIANIHGHLHGNVVKDDKGMEDKRYINVCVEHTNYVPIHIEDMVKKVKKDVLVQK